jgi:hypothetical protein
MSHPNYGQNPPKICPLPFDQADKIDRNIRLLADQLDSLTGDIAGLLYDVTGDRRLRRVQAELKSALKHLEAAKLPARVLWNAAHEAALSAHQGGRSHG